MVLIALKALSRGIKARKNINKNNIDKNKKKNDKDKNIFILKIN